jgi:small subunit ribosomal protein S4
MKIGPKFKIAKRLGAPIFEKTQTQKFRMKMEAGTPKGKKGNRNKSSYGLQLIEKQKARFTYGITAGQFGKYIKQVIDSKTVHAPEELYKKLETRLDNVVYRMGLSNTRRFARQIVSHGHIILNGVKNTVASTVVKPGDIIAIREGSKKTKTFADVPERLKSYTVQDWLSFDIDKMSGKMTKLPTLQGQDVLFDLGQVIEFSKR